MVTPSQLTVLITAIGYPCRTYTMSNTHRNPQLLKVTFMFQNTLFLRYIFYLKSDKNDIIIRRKFVII